MIALKNVTYTYPFQDRPAVTDVSLTVNPGEVVLVTGASGCGKSTLIRLVNGLCPCFFAGTLEGEIRHKGVLSTGRTLHEISEEVGTVFQDPELQFFALNVEDELAFAHEWRGKDPETVTAIVRQTAKELGISHILGANIHDLSEGQKQKVALGSVLSLRPSVVVLDEPSANLDPESTKELAGRIEKLKADGICVLVVDHRLYWLEDVADRVVVMEAGKIAEEGAFSLLADPVLRKRYGLRAPQVTDVRHTLLPVPEKGHLVVENLQFSYPHRPKLFDGLSFALPTGVTGIIGDNGTGKTTLARILTGLTRWHEGEIRIGGRVLRPKEVLKRAGIILQNTDHQLHMRTVLLEIAMAAGIFRPKGRKKEALLNALGEFGLAHLAFRHPQSLSGGEKQRLVIACGLIRNPDVLILDEPTSGLDGENMMRIARMMRSAAEKGTCVVVITHDLELLEEVCDVALRLPDGEMERIPCLKTA